MDGTGDAQYVSSNPLLRSLDAIHLATALLVRDDIEVMLTYDDRLRVAAESHGLATAAPR